MASLAGLVVIGLNAAADPNTLGTGIELDAIAAIAIGGTALSGGRVLILGTIGGALVMQLLTYTLIVFGVPNSGAMLVKAIVIALAVSAYVWSAKAR
jgi:ribose/xylose/arabinose/galactoside ABC-type transport system permease subunit